LAHAARPAGTLCFALSLDAYHWLCGRSVRSIRKHLHTMKAALLAIVLLLAAQAQVGQRGLNRARLLQPAASIQADALM